MEDAKIKLVEEGNQSSSGETMARRGEHIYDESENTINVCVKPQEE